MDTSRSRLEFSWRLQAGANAVGHYGLMLARAVGFPSGVLDTAEEIVAGGRVALCV